MSRNAHKPTAESRNMVQLLTGMGSGADDVARVLGVTARTIFRHYRVELDRGVAVANMNVAQSLYRKAMGNGPQSVAACIFWMKTRGGWREVDRREITGADGGPIDLRALSTEQLVGLIIEHEGPPGEAAV
jgi:hypothetical protein